MKIKLISVLFVALLVAGCSPVNIDYSSPSDISYVSSTSSPTPTKTLAMEECKINDGRFSVSIPEGWTSSEDKSVEGATMIIWTSPDEDAMMGITHTTLVEATIASFTAEYVGTMKNNLPEGMTLTNKKITIDGFDGEEYRISGAYGEYYVPYLVVLLFENDNVYVLTCLVQPENSSKYEDVFYTAQKSLHINDIQ